MSTKMTQIERTFARAFEHYRPPEPLTVSEWAEKYRVLSRESTAEAGPWRNKRTPYMVEPMNAFNNPNVKEIAVVAPSQVGKALAIDTPIPTPTGWTTMGDIKTGDTVFGLNGELCKVTACTEIMYNRPCYELTFSDGEKIVADAAHGWYVQATTPLEYPNGKNRKAIYDGVVTTEQIAKDYLYFKADKRKKHRYAIPVNGPLKLNEARFLLPPYTLGAWLGDGNSHSAQITTAKKDIEIIENIKAEGVRVAVREKTKNIYNTMIMPKTPISEMRYCIRGHDMEVVGRTKKGLCAECARQTSKHFQYGFVMDDVTNVEITGNSLLLKMGVIKNKHIPKECLRGSYEQRLSLLQGIMDTDGTISKNGRCEITLKSERLANDVAELLRTLGIKPTVKTRLAVCTNSKKKTTVNVTEIAFMAYSETPVFRLKRKLERMVSANGTGKHGKPCRVSETTRRRIIEVRKIKSVPVKCIAVDSENRLYLAGRAMIPTHNSEIQLNTIGYIIDQDPGSTLYIQPNLDDAKKFSRLRIAPMLRDSPRLRNKVAEVKSRDSGNTVLQKTFSGGMLTMVGSQSPSALASTPARYVIGDEIDRWATSAGTEGDPWELAAARTTTFYNAKMVAVSTPTIKGYSRIERLFNRGTQERWHSQCPDCGGWVNISFDDIKFDYETKREGRKKSYTLKSVKWCCPLCGTIHTEEEMRAQPSKWIAENPEAINRGRRSFWLNAFSSPWRSWEEICLGFLECKDDPEQLKVFFNTILGELWENRGELAKEDEMLSRREDYGTREDGTPIELPEGVLVLTCGVDTQDDRLEGEIVGWGHYQESWGIKKFTIMGDPNDDAPWIRLDEIIDRVYKFENGRGLKIAITFVDSGGHKTQSVYKQCRVRLGKKVFAIKGKGGDDVPYTRPPSKVNIIAGGKAIARTYLYTIGVDAGKAAILQGAMRVTEPGPKYCHFPTGDRGYDINFFNGLLSETFTMKTDRGRSRWVWEKLPGHERNEALDCRNYALAALFVLDPDMDAVERKIKEQSGEWQRQEKPAAPKPKRQKVKRNKATYSDEW